MAVDIRDTYSMQTCSI